MVPGSRGRRSALIPVKSGGLPQGDVIKTEEYLYLNAQEDGRATIDARIKREVEQQTGQQAVLMSYFVLYDKVLR